MEMDSTACISMILIMIPRKSFILRQVNALSNSNMLWLCGDFRLLLELVIFVIFLQKFVCPLNICSRRLDE